MSRFVRWLEEVGLDDVPLVGGKNASLGELIRSLAWSDVRVPGGFVITADAYSELLKAGKIEEALRDTVSRVDKDNPDQLASCGQTARALIKQAGLPAAVEADLREAYAEMERRYGRHVDVAVRSSATAEDLPEASFAGQQESFLNIRGETALLEACLNCFASLFTDRAISYRIDQGFDHMSVRLSIGVQKMVRSDLAVSGVLFTLDPESGFRDVVLVTASYGLGENLVAGRVDPDEFLVFKPTLATGHRPIIRRKIGAKQFRMVYAGHGTRTTRNLETLPEDRQRLCLSDDEALLLARWGCLIEQHYSARHGRPTPMDVEWAKDGIDGLLYVVQARPETVHALKNVQVLESYRLDEQAEVLLTGRAIGQRIGTGPARLIKSAHELGRFRDGDVLVTDMTDPDWEPIMKRAAAIVTNRGGRTCHAAIVSREIGVPCIVGTGRATETLTDDRDITVNCAGGDVGTVLAGRLAFTRTELRLDEIPKTRTKIMLNLGNPEQAFSLSALPVAGVGLAREEFIIAHEVKVHPLALTRFDSLADPAVAARIGELTRLYERREDYFVDKLAEGIATIAAAFYPREVIVRLSDFKTNEYANLLGGAQFEPREENPMIGFRGASRYYDERYRDGFALECRSISKVRDEMGLTNLKVMIPFCRTVEEGERVIAEMAANGLVRGHEGLEVYVMCELPANVVAADLFAQVFDGFSIGSNDLTQLVLGLDRDSEIIAHLFDERNEAVKRTVAQAIAAAKRAGRKIGICGQAPSDYPDFARFLVEQGIDSMSLNEDAVVTTLLMVADVERELAQAGEQPVELSGLPVF
ncbi:MAG TPA: phosphoenolpyruvate synthase [Candidatus Obscuribacterales bacterium]